MKVLIVQCIPTVTVEVVYIITVNVEVVHIITVNAEVVHIITVIVCTMTAILQISGCVIDRSCGDGSSCQGVRSLW